MKRAAFLAVLLFLNSFCFSQRPVSPWEIELRAGVAAPIGQFSDGAHLGDPTVEKPDGLAMMGPLAQGSILYNLNEKFGLMVTGSWQSNKQKKASFQRWLASSNADIDVNSWIVKKAMAGGWVRTKLGSDDRLRLRLSLQGGICQTAIPGLSYTRYDQYGNPTNSSSHGKIKLDPAACFEAGAHLHRDIAKRFSALLGVSYFSGTVKQDIVYRPDISDPTEVSLTRRYGLSSVNIDCGVSFRL